MPPEKPKSSPEDGSFQSSRNSRVFTRGVIASLPDESGIRGRSSFTVPPSPDGQMFQMASTQTHSNYERGFGFLPPRCSDSSQEPRDRRLPTRLKTKFTFHSVIFNRVGRRVWWIPTHASPSSNRTGGFPASGSRRLFAGLLHERAYAVCCDDLPCSWLAGIGSAAGSELPLPFSGTVGVTIPFGPSPRSLSALDSSAQLPLLRSTPLSGASRLL